MWIHIRSVWKNTVDKSITTIGRQTEIDWLIEHGLTSAPTQYRLYGWRVFTGQTTQPTVSKYWRRMLQRKNNLVNRELCYQTLLTYLKEVEERDRTDGVAKVWCMLEEKHASQTGVDDVWMTVWHTDEVQSLLPAVSSSPERQRRLVLPAGTGVRLDGHHIQRHPETTPKNHRRNNMIDHWLWFLLSVIVI